MRACSQRSGWARNRTGGQTNPNSGLHTREVFLYSAALPALSACFAQQLRGATARAGHGVRYSNGQARTNAPLWPASLTFVKGEQVCLRSRLNTSDLPKGDSAG